MWTFCQHPLSEWERSRWHHLERVSHELLCEDFDLLRDVNDPETPKMLTLSGLNANVGVATTPGMLVIRSGEPKRQPDIAKFRTKRVTS
jgi:hypothetical protein